VQDWPSTHFCGTGWACAGGGVCCGWQVVMIVVPLGAKA